MKEVKVSEIKPRRKFDAAFKREAVALWLRSGKSAREVAAELGIPEKHLYVWKKAHAPANPIRQSQMATELAALRRENGAWAMGSRLFILEMLDWYESATESCAPMCVRRLEQRAEREKAFKQLLNNALAPNQE